MFTRVMLPRRVGGRPQCFNDNISPYVITQKRLTLKRQFYSIQRPVTLDEVNMILQPMFNHVNLSINVINDRVHIVFNNVLQKEKIDTETALSVLDLVNEWCVHDELRRFMIKSLTNANRNNVYRYDKTMTWSCPLSVEYVFKESE